MYNSSLFYGACDKWHNCINLRALNLYIMQSSLNTTDLAEHVCAKWSDNFDTISAMSLLITCLNACSSLLSDTKFVLTCVKRGSLSFVDSKFIIYVLLEVALYKIGFWGQLLWVDLKSLNIVWFYFFLSRRGYRIGH